MRIVAACVLVMVAACSQGVSVDNGNPSGTVAGVIVDASSEQPLTGATINIVAGDKALTAMTDMNGQFAVGKVPAGSFILTVQQMGYASAQLTDLLSGSVGNFPVSNPQKTVGPIGLLPASGTFTVRVVDETGAAVPNLKLGARTHVRQILYQNGQPTVQGAYQVSTTTGADGNAVFNGLPLYGSLAGLSSDIDWLDIAVPPTKVMGSEQYNFLGGVFTFKLNSLASSAQTISLPGPNSALVILDSNIQYLKGRSGSGSPPFNAAVGSVVPINGPITIAFNQAIDAGSLRAQFFDADGKLLSATAMSVVSLNVVALSPSAPLPAGKRFNLILHATAATDAGTVGGGSAIVSVTAPFFTAPPAGAPIVAVGMATLNPIPAAGPITYNFELSEPIGVGYGINNPLDCVVFYAVSGSPAGFNNDPGVAFQGDWKTTPASTPPTNLVCRQPLGAVGNPQINVTGLTPLESTNPTTNPTILTGFTSKFSITTAMSPTNMNAGPCKIQAGTPALPGCTPPGSGTTVHLIFSKQDSSTTVTRVTGQPLPDSITVTLP